MKHSDQRTARTWPGPEGCEGDSWEELPLSLHFPRAQSNSGHVRNFGFLLNHRGEGREGSAEKKRRGD